MPITKLQLDALLDYLEAVVFRRGTDGTILMSCDNSLRKTEEFMSGLGVWSRDVRRWLASYGGYCDCEVSLNVGDYWKDRL